MNKKDKNPKKLSQETKSDKVKEMFERMEERIRQIKIKLANQ